MRSTTLAILTTSMLALGVVLPIEPARAQHACDLNGAIAPDLTIFPGELYCGDIGSFFQMPNQTAVGEGASISGIGATVIGASSVGFDDGSTAVGFHADAGDSGGGFFLPLPTNFSQTVLGSYSLAEGLGSVAIGDQAAVGVPDLVTQPGAILYDPVDNGTAVGSHSLVSADGGTAFGASAQATAANSVAIGANSVADQANTVSVGAAGSERRIVNVAAGTAATDAVNLSQLGAVSTNVTTLQTNVIALQAADAAFDTRIDALESAAIGFDEDLDRIDDRASAGTATAVALSGAMFLPGKTFNLTGNVGTYRGAYAGALQFGALVSNNVALNAGVAHGFNRGGKTALRAGFTVGW